MAHSFPPANQALPPSSKRPRLLIIDDQGSIVTAQNYNSFCDAGYKIELAGSAAKALFTLTDSPPDLILLEANLPRHSGYDLEAFIRSMRQIPLILISHQCSLEDKLFGLSIGADDYLGIPYDLRELLMRISVLLRRWMNRHPNEKVVTIGQLMVDPVQRKVFLGGDAIDVGMREFDLISYLAHNPNRFIGRDELLNKVWHLPTPAATNIVQVCINGLRNKLLGQGKEIIQTVRGVGYRGLGYSLGKVE